MLHRLRQTRSSPRGTAPQTWWSRDCAHRPVSTPHNPPVCLSHWSPRPLPSPSKSQPPTHSTDKSRVGNHLVCWPVGSLNTSQDKTLQRSEFTVYPIGDHHRLLGHRTRDTPPRAPPTASRFYSLCPHTPRRGPLPQDSIMNIWNLDVELLQNKWLWFILLLMRCLGF